MNRLHKLTRVQLSETLKYHHIMAKGSSFNAIPMLFFMRHREIIYDGIQHDQENNFKKEKNH